MPQLATVICPSSEFSGMFNARHQARNSTQPGTGKVTQDTARIYIQPQIAVEVLRHGSWQTYNKTHNKGDNASWGLSRTHKGVVARLHEDHFRGRGDSDASAAGRQAGKHHNCARITLEFIQCLHQDYCQWYHWRLSRSQDREAWVHPTHGSTQPFFLVEGLSAQYSFSFLPAAGSTTEGHNR